LKDGSTAAALDALEQLLPRLSVLCTAQLNGWVDKQALQVQEWMQRSVVVRIVLATAPKAVSTQVWNPVSCHIVETECEELT